VTFRFQTSSGVKISPLANPAIQDQGDSFHRPAPCLFAPPRQAGFLDSRQEIRLIFLDPPQSLIGGFIFCQTKNMPKNWLVLFPMNFNLLRPLGELPVEITGSGFVLCGGIIPIP